MRWIGRRQSSNVDDRRADMRRGGGIPGNLFSRGGIGAVVLLIVISLILGKNPLSLLDESGVISLPDAATTETASPNPAEDEMAAFTRVVLADTEDVWNQLMATYREPVLVLFSREVESACGVATSSTGPFYCPADQHVYIDLSFYEDLKAQLGAGGDFAQAYVIAHEVGHHVQNLLGITEKVHRLRGEVSETEYNQLSVRLELQADFLAGVWAHHAQKMKNSIEPGDFEEALGAANAIGDDRLQQQARGYVIPDSFTHGTSEQRMHWFRKGYETGDLAQGDTFSAKAL